MKFNAKISIMMPRFVFTEQIVLFQTLPIAPEIISFRRICPFIVASLIVNFSGWLKPQFSHNFNVSIAN